MRNDPPEAAVRLSSQLTVRTHERIFYTHQQGSKLTPQIIVGEQVFRSRLAVRAHFHIGSATLNDWIDTGKARIA